MKTLTAISPSQIETFLSCERKWWLNKILGLPIPQHPRAALGEQVHKGQENYLETGDEAQVHALAKGTLPILRALRERKATGRVFMERSLRRQLRNGLDMVGRIDILDAVDRPLLVLDWKTTSNPADAKTEEELRSNVQMLTYAYEATVLDIELNGVPKDRQGVDVAHVVIPTKGGVTPFKRATHIPLDDIHAGWKRIQDISDTMLATSKLTDPVDVKPNLSACNAFGGCSFQSRCAALKATTVAPAPSPNPTPTAQDKKTMPVPNAPYAAILSVFPSDAAIRAAFPNMTDAEFAGWKNAGSAPAPAAEPAPQVVRGVVPPEAGDRRAPAPTSAPQVIEAEENEEYDEKKWKDMAAHLKNLGWPEDAIACLPDAEFLKVAKKGWRFEDCEWDEKPSEENPGCVDYVEVRKKKVVAPVVEQAPAEPAPRRRGRPPGSKNKTTTEAAPEARVPVAQVAEQQPVAALSPAVEPPKDEAPVKKDEAPTDHEKEAYSQTIRERDATIQKQAVQITRLEKQLDEKDRLTTEQGKQLAAQDIALNALRNTTREERVAALPAFILYVDCLPEKGMAYRHLDDVIAPFHKLAAENYQDEKTGKPQPLAHYSLIPFGKGPGLVAAYVTRNVTEVAQGAVVVDTRSPAAMAVLEVLRPMADVVVRGMGR